MSIESQFEREEDILNEEYNNGTITKKEYDDQMRDLYQSHRDMAQDAAQAAYDSELGNW